MSSIITINNNKVTVNKTTMLNIYNIVSKKFYPLDCFSNLKNSLDIINNYTYRRNFFPFPIMFPILKSDEVKLKK